MSEKSSSANDSSPEQGMVSKIVSFVTSKKGMYIIAAVALVCVAYYCVYVYVLSEYMCIYTYLYTYIIYIYCSLCRP